MQLLLETKQDASHNGVRIGRYLIQRIMSSMIVDRSTCRRLLLAYSEMANNIVFHSQPKATFIGIKFLLTNDHWEVVLSDDGGVWKEGLSMDHKDKVIDSSMEWQESGRGLAIVGSVIDDTEYHAKTSTDEVNTLFLRIKRQFSDYCKPHVLLLCNDHTKSMLLEVLDSDFKVNHFQTVKGVLEDIDGVNPDIILASLSNDDLLGYELREALLQNKHYDLVPFIFLTKNDFVTIPSSRHYLDIDAHIEVTAEKEIIINTIDRVLKTYRLLGRKFSSRINIQINHGLSDTSYYYAGHSVASALRSTEIGGGDYIFSQKKGGRTLLILVDIMGHDESAKFFTYAHAGYFRGIIHSLQTIDLVAIMKMISNASFYDDLLRQTTMTFIAACFYENGQVGLCSAGHPPPWLIDGSDAIPMAVKGTMPGLIEDMDYEEYLWQPKKGERIALFTDGLVESATDAISRKALEEGIMKQLVDTQSFSVHQSVEKVMTWFDLQVGSPPLDDTTLILIEG